MSITNLISYNISSNNLISGDSDNFTVACVIPAEL